MYQLNLCFPSSKYCCLSFLFPVFFLLITLEGSLYHGFDHFSYSLLLLPPLSWFATTMGRILEKCQYKCVYERLKSFTYRLFSQRMTVNFFVVKIKENVSHKLVFFSFLIRSTILVLRKCVFFVLRFSFVFS